MFDNFLASLFGCSHRRTTFPMTRGRKFARTTAPAAGNTYVVCLDCGKEFAYDWKSMTIGEAVEVTPAATQSAVATR